jgi:hypothetical protein
MEISWIEKEEEEDCRRLDIAMWISNAVFQ